MMDELLEEVTALLEARSKLLNDMMIIDNRLNQKIIMLRKGLKDGTKH